MREVLLKIRTDHGAVAIHFGDGAANKGHMARPFPLELDLTISEVTSKRGIILTPFRIPGDRAFPVPCMDQNEIHNGLWIFQRVGMMTHTWFMENIHFPAPFI